MKRILTGVLMAAFSLAVLSAPMGFAASDRPAHALVGVPASAGIWVGAPQPGTVSLFFLGMALVLAGVRRRQTAELKLALLTETPPAR